MGNQQAQGRRLSVEDDEIVNWSWRKEKGKQWYIASGARELEKNCITSFEEYASEREIVFKNSFQQLEKDIIRTNWKALKPGTVWQNLVREREERCGRAAHEKAIMDVLIAFIRREERGDGHGSRSYTQGLNYVACLLLLFVDEEEKAFWLLCSLIERIAPPDFYAEPPGSLAGTAGEAAIVHALLKKLPYTQKYSQQDDAEITQLCQVLTIKMGIPLLIDCVEPTLLVFAWDCLFLHRDFDIIPCVIAGTVECVCKCMSTKKMQLYDEEDNCASSGLLCSVLRGLDSGFPLAHISDVQQCINTFNHRNELREIRSNARAALAKSWSEPTRLNDLTQLGFSVDDLVQLQQAFVSCSPHGHYLDRHQFLLLVQNIAFPLPPDAADHLLQLVDSDGDGKLDFREVICFLSTLSCGSIHERLSFMFAMYDADNSGFLEWIEVEQLSKACQGHDLLHRLKALDLDGDGRISRQEWLLAATSSPDIIQALGFSVIDPPCNITTAPRGRARTCSTSNKSLVPLQQHPLHRNSDSNALTNNTILSSDQIPFKADPLKIDSTSTRALRALQSIRSQDTTATDSEYHTPFYDDTFSQRTSIASTDAPSRQLRFSSASERSSCDSATSGSSRREAIMSFLFGRCSCAFPSSASFMFNSSPKIALENVPTSSARMA